MSRPRTLCLIPHYVGTPDKARGFVGGSTSDPRLTKRREYAERSLGSLKRLSAIMDIDIVVGGLAGFNILPIDIDYTGRIHNPLQILSKLLSEARNLLQGYDHLMIVEDDLVVPLGTAARMLDGFREITDPRRIIFPNRIETYRGIPLAIDLYAMRGWTGAQLDWHGQTWHEARNCHSGFLFFGPRQIALMADIPVPDEHVGYFMAPAFKAAHAGFTLLREKRYRPRHAIYHLDNWFPRNEPSFKRALFAYLDQYTRDPVQLNGRAAP